MNAMKGERRWDRGNQAHLGPHLSAEKTCPRLANAVMRMLALYTAMFFTHSPEGWMLVCRGICLMAPFWLSGTTTTRTGAVKVNAIATQPGAQSRSPAQTGSVSGEQRQRLHDGFGSGVRSSFPLGSEDRSGAHMAIFPQLTKKGTTFLLYRALMTT